MELEFVATFVGWGYCDRCSDESDELMAYHGSRFDRILCDACAAKEGVPMWGYPKEEEPR